MAVHFRQIHYLFFYCRLLKNFSSNSFLHKEMLAILAALTEVIKANGGKESSTEYFASLVNRFNLTIMLAIITNK
jgi:hypothetical protein